MNGRAAYPERCYASCRIARALSGWMGARGSRMCSLTINTKVLPKLRCLASENHFHEWKDLATIQSEDGAFMCQATPKGSCGEYLYIGCWEVEK